MVRVLGLGRGTKAVPLLMATDKEYESEVDLSAFMPILEALGLRAAQARSSGQTVFCRAFTKGCVSAPMAIRCLR